MGIIRTLSDIHAQEGDPKVNASLKGNQYLIFKNNLNSKKRAVARDFQQCGVLTSVDSDEPLQPPFKLRNSKWCSVSS